MCFKSKKIEKRERVCVRFVSMSTEMIDLVDTDDSEEEEVEYLKESLTLKSILSSLRQVDYDESTSTAKRIVLNGVDIITAIDPGSRNIGICQYSIVLDKVLWWTWLDLQAGGPVDKLSNLVDRLTHFVQAYKTAFDQSDVIVVEKQTEVHHHRANMMIETSLRSLFVEKTVDMQNTHQMATFVKRYAPKGFIEDLKKKGRTSKTIKKRCTISLGERLSQGSGHEKHLFNSIINSRKALRKRLMRKKEREEAMVTPSFNGKRAIGRKRKRQKGVKWSPNIKTPKDDIWDAYVMCIMAAKKHGGVDLVEERLRLVVVN